MIHMRARHLLILCGTLAASTAGAQEHVPGKDTVMKGATIEVIQAYKPQVKQAPKPEWVPQLPPPDTTHKAVNYDDVPQQSLYYTYTSLPLHPLALGKDDQKLPYPDYIKLGAGNLNTIYLDAGLGMLYGKDYETAIHLHHLSQKGSILNQQSAQTGFEAEGMLHTDNADWHAGITGEQNRVYDYGYRHDLYRYSADSVKQTYTLVRFDADMKNKGDSTDRLTYHPAISGSEYTAKAKTAETNVGFDVPLAYKIENSLQAQLSLSGAITSLKTDTLTTANNFVKLEAGFAFHNNLFTGHALLGYAAGKDGNNYLLPDILASYSIPDARCTLFAGVQSSLKQNTYEQLTADNPYIYNNYKVKQTSSGEYFGGVQGGVENHFTYSARLSYWDIRNMAGVVNNDSDQKQFKVIFYSKDVTALSLQLGIRYRQAEKWSAGLTGSFYQYSAGGVHYVFGVPSTTLKGDFIIRPVNKLTFTAYLSVMGGIYAQDSYTRIVKLNAFADLGGSAEYQFAPRISAFLQLNNIMNNQYQRWLGYQAYGLNIYGGLRLKF